MTDTFSDSRQYSSDLTRQLVDDADMATRFAPEPHAIPKEEEDQAIANLLKDYEKLDGELRTELATLATLLAEEEAQPLRAVICRPGKVAVSTSADHMEAYLEVTPPEGGGKAVSTPQVVELLRAQGITFGVDLHTVRTVIDETARTGHPSPRTRIAVGRPPVPGSPGRIEVDAPDALVTKVGSRQIRQWMIKKGDILARLVPPTAGTPGVNVLGQSLPAMPGAIVRLQVVQGSGYDEQEGIYRATIDGLARFDGHTLEVRRQLIWPGDLTIHDKPIDFDGTVLIRGSLRDGAQVQATEDIEIQGGVEGATVISTGGSVTVRQGVVGRGRGFVAAKTSVDARYLENATVYAQEDIVARHAVVHSRLTAGNRVRVELDKGAIFGGEIKAGAAVHAKTLGNPAGVATRVSVGYDWSTLSQLQQVEAELATLRQRTALCEHIIAGFRRAKPNAAQLSLTERNALCAVLKRHLVLRAKIRACDDRYKSLEASATQAVTGDVVCRETLYAGTHIRIGGAGLQVTTSIPSCTISFQRDSKKLVALAPSGRSIPLSVVK